MLLANTTLASSQRSISSGYQARYRASGRSSRENLRGTGVKSLRSLPEKELRSTGDYRTCVRSMERMEVCSSRGKECERDASTELLRKQARHEASGKKTKRHAKQLVAKAKKPRRTGAKRAPRNIRRGESFFGDCVSRNSFRDCSGVPLKGWSCICKVSEVRVGKLSWCCVPFGNSVSHDFYVIV